MMSNRNLSKLFLALSSTLEGCDGLVEGKLDVKAAFLHHTNGCCPLSISSGRVRGRVTDESHLTGRDIVHMFYYHQTKRNRNRTDENEKNSFESHRGGERAWRYKC